MSHEIRTPLTSIIGFAELALESGQTMEDRLNGLKTIAQSGNHLLTIINDILDLSKIEAAKLGIEKLNFSPTQLLDDIKSLVQLQSQEKGLEFSINYSFPIPRKITSDPLRLKQIILNLCSNALKFTHDGSVQINVSADIEREQMSFEVIDSGIGMSNGNLEKMFEEFSQADVQTTRRYGGPGLGLSISRKLARLLGGDVTVTSQVGIGSRFKCTIETGEISPENILFRLDTQHSEKTSELENLLQKLHGRVLLAEDVEVNRLLFKTLLNRIGAEVTTVANGAEAVEYALKNQYDLILMDIQMPVMDGIIATKMLRERSVSVPIIALTANVMKEDQAKYTEVGFNGFVGKPVQRTELYAIVKQYLDICDFSETSEPIYPRPIDDNEIFSTLSKKYAKNVLPEFVNEARTHVSNQNWNELKQTIHKLKGTGSGYGYPCITELCKKVEFELAKEDWQSVKTLVSQLEKMQFRISLGVSTETSVFKSA